MSNLSFTKTAQRELHDLTLFFLAIYEFVYFFLNFYGHKLYSKKLYRCWTITLW